MKGFSNCYFCANIVKEQFCIKKREVLILKLFTYVYEQKEQIGVLSSDEKNIIPLQEKDMQTLIENWSELKQKRELLFIIYN